VDMHAIAHAKDRDVGFLLFFFDRVDDAVHTVDGLSVRFPEQKRPGCRFYLRASTLSPPGENCKLKCVEGPGRGGMPDIPQIMGRDETNPSQNAFIAQCSSDESRGFWQAKRLPYSFLLIALGLISIIAGSEGRASSIDYEQEHD
jgi:hypothetical protein